MTDPHARRQGSPVPRVVVSNRQGLPLDEAGLAWLAERVLAGEGAPQGELALSFVSAGEMQELHERFVDEPGPTDVLAFPMGEEGMLGDVVICPGEARANNPDLEAELRLLVVHGTLHLLGHDHEEAEDRRRMWARQERYSGIRVEDSP
jgi:probable rRNA maturation factor